MEVDQNYPLDAHMRSFPGLLEEFTTKIPFRVSIKRKKTMRKMFKKVYCADNKDVFLRFLLFDKKDMEIPFAITYALMESVGNIDLQKWSILPIYLIHFIAHYNNDDFHSFLHTKLQEGKFKDDIWNTARQLCSNEPPRFFEGVISLLDIQNKKIISLINLKDDQFETTNDKMLISFMKQKGKGFFQSWSEEQKRSFRKKICKMTFFSDTSLSTYEKMVVSGNIVPKGTNVSGVIEKIVQDEFNQILNFLVKRGRQKNQFIQLFNFTLCLIAFSFDFNCVDAMRAAQVSLHKCIELHNSVDIVMRNKSSKELFCVLKKGNVFRSSVCNYCIENLLVTMRRFWKLSPCDVFGEQDDLNFLQVEVKSDILANRKEENIVKHIVNEDEKLKLPLKKRKYEKI
jgi:hypothetical protein